MAQPPQPPGGEVKESPSTLEAALERGLAASRLFVLIPVLVLTLAALGAFVYAAYVSVDSARRIVERPTPVGDKVGLFLLVVDLFLIGATLLITAVGFYELFLNRRSAASATHLPSWLAIGDLNDLKARVIGMVVLVAAVSYVESIVDVHSSTAALDTGLGIAVVVLALTLFLRLGEHGGS